MKSEAARTLDLTARKSVLAGSLKLKACVSMGAECQKQAEVKQRFGERSAARTVCLNELKAINHQLAADAPIDEIRP
jgi:hypothetical protein